MKTNQVSNSLVYSSITRISTPKKAIAFFTIYSLEVENQSLLIMLQFIRLYFAVLSWDDWLRLPVNMLLLPKVDEPCSYSGLWMCWMSAPVAAVIPSSTVGEGELQKSFCMHLVEEFELSRQLMGLLPFGGELGSLLVIVVVWQLFTCVGVPAKGPKPI